MSARWAERLRRFFRPPRRLRMTASGRTFVLLTLGVGIGALNTGNNLLYLVLGLQLATIVVSGVLSERVLRDLEVRRIGTEAAFASEPFAFRWSVKAPKRAAYALSVSERSDALEGEGALPYLPRGEERVVRGTLFCGRRGPQALSEIDVTTTFPLGLFAKSRTFFAEDRLLVFPRRTAAEAKLPEGERGPIGSAPDLRRSDGQGEPAGLRPLRDGEPARGIHWVKSATRGTLLKVERDREVRHAYELALPHLEGNALERECERVAALATRLLDEGHEVGLTTEARKLRPAMGPRQLARVLQALAWAGFEQEDAR